MPYGTATAPYNFVPLPSALLRAPMDDGATTDEGRQDAYRAYVEEHGTLAGTIELTITAETPVFVGAGNSDRFFSPVDAASPVIPGSTLRGMTKNLVKILTCGAMRATEDDADFNDKRLYFRTMASSDNGLRNLYQKELCERGSDKKMHNCAQAGFLIHDSKDQAYYICPTTFRVEEGPKNEVENHPAEILWNPHAVTCYTGPMNKKRHYTVHDVPQDFGERLPVHPAIVQSYRDDITRDGLNLLKAGKQQEEAADFTHDSTIDFVAPCFYAGNEKGIRHFGFGRNYRIPYQKSIGDHVPRFLQSEGIDFADALFGRKELWGSRLAFEDAPATTKADPGLAAYPKVLSSPKPTSFQLYLTQKNPDHLDHWNTNDVHIRGYKLYWHQPQANWRGDQANVNTKITPHKLTPMPAGTVFCGRIRFSRLAPVELGALLKCFELAEKNPNLRYKIGQGKSLGLGSVRIDAKLRMLDEKKNAAALFTPDGAWERAEHDEPPAAYTEAFDEYLQSHLDAKGKSAYQALLRALTKLLDYHAAASAPDWSSRVRAMTIDQGSDNQDKPFQNRWILPNATEV